LISKFLKTNKMEQKKKSLGASIRSKILAALEINDEGKVLAFLDYSVKQLNREISSRTHNLSTEKMEFEKSIERLGDQLQDAQEDLEASYFVDVTALKSSVDKETYFGTYMAQIKAAESKVKSIQERIDSETKRFKENEEKTNTQISSLRESIAKLSE